MIKLYGAMVPNTMFPNQQVRNWVTTIRKDGSRVWKTDVDVIEFFQAEHLKKSCVSKIAELERRNLRSDKWRMIC